MHGRSLWTPSLIVRRPALAGSSYPPLTSDRQPEDDEDDQLAREFDEFEAEELFEDEEVTGRPQQKATAGMTSLSCA